MLNIKQYILDIYAAIIDWCRNIPNKSSKKEYGIPSPPGKVLPNTCCVCGKPLIGVFYSDWEGNKVCDEHKNAICNSCHRYYGTSATEVENGIYLCYSCMTHLITSKSVEHIVGRIRYYYRHLGLEVKSRIKLRVVTQHEMSHLYGKECRGYVVCPADSDGYQVVVLRHLSQSVFASVMAHEILHIWQYEKNINPPDDICEGFCNLGSYLFMQTIGTPTAKGLLTQFEMDNSAIYGKGFAQMKSLYDAKGINGVIAEMNRYK